MSTNNCFIYLFALLLLSCTGNESQSTSDSNQPTVSSDTIVVTSYTSRFEKLSYPVTTIGKIKSRRTSNLVFERSGILESIRVANGDKVENGQVIATMRNTKESLEVENALITLKKAKINYENEMIALGDSLYYKERWATVKENVELNTGVMAAEVNLKQAELAYRQTIIRAPISGIIEGIILQPGDLVTSNQPLGTLYDASNFEVHCDVLEYDVMKIRKGMDASIHLLADKERQLTGTVTEVNPAVDQKGLSRIRIQLKNTRDIIPGLSVRVSINVTDQPSIVIPLQAVVKRSERHVVFHIDKGLAKWNYVTLGKDNGEKVQILEGLKEDMEIITSNNLQLAHDSPVRHQ